MTDPTARADELSRLLERASRGDRAAFASLYRETSAKLFAVSLRIVRERQLAEEVLQDSFVAIWHHAAEYSRAKSAPVTWMAAVVRNRSLDLLRRRSREVEDVDEALAGALVDETAAPAADFERRAGEHAVHECLGELEPDQRQSIALAFFHGLSHSELAGHLRRPLGTVKTHIRRGLARLRECLERAGAAPR